MTKAAVWTCLLALAAADAAAQTTGVLHLQLDPANYEYVLDHKFRMAKPDLELATGTHHFSFWAPMRNVVDTSLVVEEGQTKRIVLRLPYSKDYLVHQRELQQFKANRNLRRGIPAAITGGALLYAALKYGKMNQAHDQLKQDREQYGQLTSPHRIAVLKEETIPAHKEELKKARSQFAVATGITVACAGATAWIFYKTGQEKRPEFIDREKLRFDGLVYQPGMDGGTWAGGLTWNFNR